MLARSLSATAQQDLAVTTTYALLKFGLQGCTTGNAIADKLQPTTDRVQVHAACQLPGYKPPASVKTAMHGVQTKDPPQCILMPRKFKQRMLNYLADNTSDPDLDVHAPYAKTYAKHPHSAGLRCFPATITQFDPCHKAMWSAAYDDAIQLTVVQKCTLSLQAHVHHMERSLYGAHAVASIAKHHARLINNKATITTLQSSAWNHSHGRQRQAAWVLPCARPYSHGQELAPQDCGQNLRRHAMDERGLDTLQRRPLHCQRQLCSCHDPPR